MHINKLKKNPDFLMDVSIKNRQRCNWLKMVNKLTEKVNAGEETDYRLGVVRGFSEIPCCCCCSSVAEMLINVTGMNFLPGK